MRLTIFGIEMDSGDSIIIDDSVYVAVKGVKCGHCNLHGEKMYNYCQMVDCGTHNIGLMRVEK